MIQSNGYVDQLDQLRSSLKLLRHVKLGFFYLYGCGHISSIGAKWILASWETWRGKWKKNVSKQPIYMYFYVRWETKWLKSILLHHIHYKLRIFSLKYDSLKTDNSSTQHLSILFTVGRTDKCTIPWVSN